MMHFSRHRDDEIQTKQPCPTWPIMGDVQRMLPKLLSAITIVLISPLIVAQDQPEPPSVIVSSSSPCELKIDGSSRGMIRPPSTKYLRLSASLHSIKCKNEDDLELTHIVDLTNSLRKNIFFNFFYLNRFHPHENVILDVERGVAWGRAGRYRSDQSARLESACADLENYLDQPFTPPTINQVASLLAAPHAASTPCGNSNCSIHPTFRLNSSSMWVAGSDSEVLQIDFSQPLALALKSSSDQFSKDADLFCVAHIFGQKTE